MINPLTKILLGTLLLATAATSCRDTDGPYAESAVLTDIAEILEPSGGAARFAVQATEDGEPAIIYVNGLTVNASEFPVGDRALLSYHYPDPTTPAYTSGRVEFDGLGTINNDKLRVDDLENHLDWNATPIYLMSIWRTGGYINISSRLTYSTKKRKFMLLVDKATVDDEVPELYLIHDILDAPDNFTRRNYASFDISALWSRESCHGVRIHIATTNMKQEIYSFNKPK